MTSFVIQQEEREVKSLEALLNTATSLVKKEEAALAETEAHLINTKTAQEILQNLAQAVQEKAHQRISEVVSSCLSAVFDDPYEFKIVFERKRGRTEAHLRFTRRDLDIDPLTASGGGMVDVAAFALRVACLVLHRPKLSRVVVLDEPFRFVSAQYQDNVRSMMEQLSKEMGVQIVLVTHNDAYSTGKEIQL